MKKLMLLVLTGLTLVSVVSANSIVSPDYKKYTENQNTLLLECEFTSYPDTCYKAGMVALKTEGKKVARPMFETSCEMGNQKSCERLKKVSFNKIEIYEVSRKGKTVTIRGRTTPRHGVSIAYGNSVFDSTDADKKGNFIIKTKFKYPVDFWPASITAGPGTDRIIKEFTR